MMGEKIELSNTDWNSPICGGGGCDYSHLEGEIASYWAKYYADKLNLEEYGDGELLNLKPVKKLSVEESNKVFQAFEDGVLGNTQMKTEEYFRKLWSDINKVGFEKEDSNHCIDTCNTLIREEVKWWEERTDLKSYKALKIPLLVEYHSWDIIWRLCKYEKLVAHPLHNHASKKQVTLKKNLPEKTTKRSISLNLETMQFAELCEGFKRIGAIDNATSLSVFKSYLNGSEINSVITPIKFKNHTYTSVFIYLCEEYGLQAQKEYFKWKEFFGIDPKYAKKQVSSFKNNHLGFPPYYHQMREIIEGLGCKPK